MNKKVRFFLRIFSPPGVTMAQALSRAEKKFGVYDIYSPAIIIQGQECRWVSFPSAILPQSLPQKVRMCDSVFSSLLSKSVLVSAGYVSLEQVITASKTKDRYSIAVAEELYFKLQLIYERSGYSLQNGTDLEYKHLLSLTFFSSLRKKLLDDVY